MALPPDVKRSYVQIIDQILASSDLNTVSEKRIRKGLQDATGHDLMPHKVVGQAEIKELIMQRFDIFAEQADSVNSSTQATASATNGHVTANGPGLPVTSVSPGPSATSQKRSAEVESTPDETETPPPSKKRKSDLIDADAAYAARLQAEENSRARPTRAARKAAPVKKKKPPTKSKTSKKVKVSDDSELDGSASETKKEVNRTGGFHLSRPQTVKKIWQYIHAHDLQDPADRRQIRCDDRMRAVFKQDRVHMFTMTKILSQNLYNPEE
ncbi:hypothetical protein PRK78_006855 [Emydomyces testavorans]|uniref:DM2 domain-containing protein n=1 Tax=Emydomyces testavorans TaxID=2070801 RepID=A0AAF0DM42_9EURO|nr:hypothetical protein PRK78_006855 [Emydomyces testavorans]